MFQSKKWTLIFAVVILVLAGVLTWDVMLATHKGHQQAVVTLKQTEPNGKVTTKVTSPVLEVPPTKALPSSVMDHLANYTTRIQEGKPTVATVGASVLIVDPSEQYAITQFQQVWKQIQPVTVVWTNTKAFAQKEWKLEGYASDPLPSSQTKFVTVPMFTPVAYHKTGSTWRVLNGVLRTSQANDWVSFFRG